MAEQADLALDTPKADAPVADAPKVEAPKADVKADAPKEDAPKADAPKADAPKLDKDGKPIEAKADAPKADDAPADYTVLKLPEGYKTDDLVFAEAVKLFEGDKLTPEQAQRYLDFTVERDKSIAKAVNDANAEAFKKTQGEWKAAAEKQHSAEDLGIAKTAMSTIFDKETLTLLESWGLTNHPGVIAGAVKVGKAIKDDTFVSGNAAIGNGGRDAKSLYPNSNMN